MNPYKVYQKNQGPAWLKGLDKYIEPQDNQPAKTKDAVVTARNHGGDEKMIARATYSAGKK